MLQNVCSPMFLLPTPKKSAANARRPFEVTLGMLKMSSRESVLRQAAEKLVAFAQSIREKPVLIGFDGFVDSIISVVETREDMNHYRPVATITRFGEKVLAAGGQSSNYELVVLREKLGGNGPIMANAMAALGSPVQFIGALGVPEIHSVFSELAARAECISIANPGLTDALEFEDGKLMLGKHQSLRDVNWQALCRVVGEDKFRTMTAEAELIGMVNWTMLLNVEEIWRKLAVEILPAVGSDKRRRKVMVDLADPEKRPKEDLLSALRLISDFQKHADLVLGLNEKEAEQVAAVLEVPFPGRGTDQVAAGIREKLNVFGVVVHPRTSAGVAWLENGKVATAHCHGPRIDVPKILTGGGDHFNAGFCVGWLAGLNAEEVIYAASGTSGYYVGNAVSPSLEQLAGFLRSVPQAAG